MERKHVVTFILAVFAAWLAVANAQAPKYGEIPNVPGMTYGWDTASSTTRALAVDSDGALKVSGIVSGGGGNATASIPFVNESGTPTPATLTANGGVPVQLVENHPNVSVQVENEYIKIRPDTMDSTPMNVRVVDGSNIPMGDSSSPFYVNPAGENRVLNDADVIVSERAKYTRINASTNGRANVAPDSVTLLSSIASITPPCTVQISCPVGQLWYAPGLATTTADSAKVHVLDEYQSVTFNVANSNWDMSLVGVDLISSCAVTIHSLVQ